ncbi:MAG: L-fucose mutarotase [Verrucomicrobiota bacterium]|nr:L-fucose mutarotase [Verrucomicrobiota bacterium]
MLRTPLLHPEILRALAAAGHGSRVLIADGNYPLSTATPATASRVYLNLRPGCVTLTEVLATLTTVLPIESALGMQTRDGLAAPIHGEFAQLLGPGVTLTFKPRHDFYTEARSVDTALAIATGEQRRFANLLLTIGVVRLPDDRS